MLFAYVAVGVVPLEADINAVLLPMSTLEVMLMGVLVVGTTGATVRLELESITENVIGLPDADCGCAVTAEALVPVLFA